MHHRATRDVTRRDFLRLAGASMTGLAAGACAPVAPGGGGPHGDGPTQLVYQDWRTPWFPAMAQEALRSFHEAHRNIRVYYTPDPENIEDRMLEDMQSGTAPDVLAGCCDFFPLWAQKGYLLDLRPYIDADLDTETVADWDPAQYRALALADGQQYGLPKYHGALAVFYNKDLFDAAGLAYPERGWDHDDYLAAMRAVMAGHRGSGAAPTPSGTAVWGSMVDIAWDRIQVHVNGFGGHFVDPSDASKSLIGAPESLAALEWLRSRMWDDRVMPSFLDVQNITTRQAFIDGHVAMVEDGSWSLKDILENASFRVGVTTFPAGPAGKVTLATTDGFGIFAGTRYPDQAWELLKFLVSRDYGRAMSEAHLLQPARSSLIGEWEGHIRDAYPDATADMDLGSFSEGHIGGYSVTAEVFPNMEDARRLIAPAFEEVFTLGRATVDKFRTVSAEIEAAQLRSG